MTLPMTPDLYLRQIDPGMNHELFRLIDLNRDHLRTWLGWVDQTTSVADVDHFIEFTKDQLAKGSLTLAIVLRERIVGVISHNGIDVDRRTVPLGYWIGKAHEGQGLIRKAVAALVMHTFTHMDVDEIHVRTAVGNVRSEKIPRSLGFTFSHVLPKAETVNGVANDLNLLCLTRDEYRQTAPDAGGKIRGT